MLLVLMFSSTATAKTLHIVLDMPRQKKKMYLSTASKQEDEGTRYAHGFNSTGVLLAVTTAKPNLEGHVYTRTNTTNTYTHLHICTLVTDATIHIQKLLIDARTCIQQDWI